MARAKLSEQEWQTFLVLADRLEIPVRALLDTEVRFTALEAAGHKFGRAVAQVTTERLALARAQRLTGASAVPDVRTSMPVGSSRARVGDDRRAAGFSGSRLPLLGLSPGFFSLSVRRWG